MPEIFRTEGYVFFFYANESQEPIHVHVRKAGGYAKFWVDPLELASSEGMKTKELSRAEDLIVDHIDEIRRKWNAVFPA